MTVEQDLVDDVAGDFPEDEWTDVADAAEEDWADAGNADGDDEVPPTLYFPNVEVFVRELLAPTYRRSLDGRHRTWCPQWWRHAEAITRLEALWRAWEHLRLDPALGISLWLRDHADPHMATLLNPDGPFKGCNPDKGHGGRLDPLPCDNAPAGLF